MLIILDRDGVINYDSHEYIKSPDEWIPIPGSLDAIARLNKAGCIVVVATNQSGVGRGYYTIAMLEQIHDKMRAELAKVGGHINDIYFCPHTPDDQCQCRKPEPGMLLQIKEKYPKEFATAVFVGDTWRDIEAAHAAGCKAVLVRTGNGEALVNSAKDLKGTPIFASLSTFADSIL